MRRLVQRAVVAGAVAGGLVLGGATAGVSAGPVSSWLCGHGGGTPGFAGGSGGVERVCIGGDYHMDPIEDF